MVKSSSRRSQSDERAEAGARAADTIIGDMEQRTPIASEGVRSAGGWQPVHPAFFPTTGIKRVPREAAELCAGCPVRADCAKVGSSVRAGVWAGHLAGHYRPRRRRRASAAPVAR